jgi:hypothetical protein
LFFRWNSRVLNPFIHWIEAKGVFDAWLFVALFLATRRMICTGVRQVAPRGTDSRNPTESNQIQPKGRGQKSEAKSRFLRHTGEPPALHWESERRKPTFAFRVLFFSLESARVKSVYPLD